MNHAGTSAAVPVRRGIVIEEFAERRSASLRGFAKVALPSGMILVDVAIHVAGTKAWASPASKAMLTRDGSVMRDDNGKIRYVPIIGFASKETRDKFSNSIIEAIRIAFPDVLAGAL